MTQFARPPATLKHGRNAPCPCGSGRKFKACCGAGRGGAREEQPGEAAARVAMARAKLSAAAGRMGEAVTALRDAAFLAPGAPEPALELGKTLVAIGRPDEALPWLERVVGLVPDSPQTHVQRGLALEKLGWHAKAAEAYQRAIALAPAFAEAHGRLGIVLLIQDQRSGAAASFRKAAELAPDSSLGRVSAAYALLADGATEQARAALQRVVRLEPKNAAVHAELGRLLAEAGKAEEAFAAFDSALRLNPQSVGHYFDLARIRRLTAADRPLVDRMLAQVRRDDIHPLDRVKLELAIGKACDDLGDPEQAMHHYTESGRLKACIRPLDRELIRKRTDFQIATFTREMFSRQTAGRSADSIPILVLGMPRSGTTLVESILACHSAVGAGQELAFWNQRGRELMESGDALGTEPGQTMAARYLQVLRDISSAPHVTDKKPDNFNWAGLIHWVFPQARIVHCRRAALDTCVSIVANFFAPRPDFSTAPDDLVFYYREYERVMAHWRSALPADRFLELDYESLVSDPESAIRRLLAFCALDFEPDCLRPERSQRTVNTASLWQVRQPIFRASVGRWRRYEPWLGELSALR